MDTNSICTSCEEACVSVRKERKGKVARFSFVRLGLQENIYALRKGAVC